MLNNIDATAILAVTDLARASQFYTEVLGLETLSADANLARFKSGRSTFVLYVSAQAGTNKANALVWGVGEQIDAIATDLIAKEVVFEHYPEMGMEFRGGLHRAGDFKGGWFKDPDGNILHINNL